MSGVSDLKPKKKQSAAVCVLSGPCSSGAALHGHIFERIRNGAAQGMSASINEFSPTVSNMTSMNEAPFLQLVFESRLGAKPSMKTSAMLLHRCSTALGL